MDFRPISCRTRSKREEAILERYREMKINSGLCAVPRRRKMRPSSHVGESNSRKQSFEWVADHVESLENQQKDEDSEGFGNQGREKRKRSLGSDDSCKDDRSWRAVSDNGVSIIELVDSDEEVVVSKGKERERGRVDVDDVSDSVSESADDVSSAEMNDSGEESEFSIDGESTEEEFVEERDSSSVEDISEEEKEEETELVEKNEKESKAESVQVGLKRKTDEDDLHSSSGCDIDERSNKISKGETVEGGMEGKTSDDGEDLHSSSDQDTLAIVTSEQELKGECLSVIPKEKINVDGDGDDQLSSSGHDIHDRSLKLGEAVSLLVKERIACDKSDHNNDEEIVGVGLEENRSDDGYNLDSTVPDTNDRSEELRKVGSVSAEEKHGWDKRREDGSEGKTGCGYSRNDNNSVTVACKTWSGNLKAKSKIGFVSKLKDDTKSVTVACKTWSGRWDECKRSAGDSSLAKRKSMRAPRQKRLPTVVFEPPKVTLSLKFGFDEKPSIPEKSEFNKEIDDLLDECRFAIAYDKDSKAKQNNFTRSENNRNNFNDVTHGGSSERAIDNARIIDLHTTFNESEAAKGDDSARPKTTIHGGTSQSGVDKGSALDVQRACNKGIEAKENNFSRSIDTRKDDNIIGTSESGFGTGSIDMQRACKKDVEVKGIDTRMDENDETYGGSCPEPYKKKGQPRKLTNKKGITDYIDFTVLLDSIYENGKMSGEQLPPLGDESPKDEGPKDQPLPRFFSLGPPPSPEPEKSTYDIETDNIFEELHFVRMSGEIGSTDSNVVETNDSLPPGKEVTQHMLCSQGKHDLILDEQIGLICKYCAHVHREIKYIVPDFAPNPYGKTGTRYYEEDNPSVLDDLQCNEPDNSGISSHALTEGTVWDLIPGVKSDMYHHQQVGFEFIWNHLAGGTELGKLAKPTAHGGDGCIISHAPGTGKTRLTIIFIQSYMNFNPASRPLIVAPRTMLLTWEEEFKKWGFDIPFHNLNNHDFNGKEDEAARNLVKDAKSKDMINLSRMVKLNSWTKKRSILGISYSLFEQICGAPAKKGKKEDSQRRKFQLEKMSEILLEFPGLVVFDEGHNPRNDQSYSWNALLKLKTRRRIILSGTPFQNNFEELYNTIRLVRPEWTTNLPCLGAFDKKQWTSDKRGRNSNAGAGVSADGNTKRAKEVKAMIDPFVNVYKGTILHDKLPGLRNSVIVFQPSALQQRYSDRTRVIKNPFKYERIEAKVTIHPSLLRTEERSLFHEKDEYSADWERLSEIRLNPEEGVKARFATDLIRLCQAMNERVLIFSQWVDPLYLLRDQLKSQFRWVEGEEVIYMDGKCDAKQRQSSMSYFNDPSTKAKVMLATTKGCSEGISLVGASRVVLLDVAWNPSVERQAISRAYRLGQEKIVHVYHLLMAGAREEDKYSRQVEKHRLSELVFSCSHTEADAKKLPPAVKEDKILEEMVQHEKLKHIFHKITLLDEASYLDEDFL